MTGVQTCALPIFIGLKENVIIGKLIPAGTGMKRYRDLRLDSDVSEEDLADYEEEFDKFEVDEIME